MPVEQGDAREGTGLAGQIAQCLYDITRGQFDVRTGYELIDAIACALAPAINDNAGGGADPQTWNETLVLDNRSLGEDPSLTNGDAFKYGGDATAGRLVSDTGDRAGTWETTIESRNVSITSGVPVLFEIASWTETTRPVTVILVDVMVTYDVPIGATPIARYHSWRGYIGTTGSIARVEFQNSSETGVWDFDVTGDVLSLRYTPPSTASPCHFSGRATVSLALGGVVT